MQALPVVLVMSVLTTLLFYWRILPPIVRGFAWLLERTLGVGGAVGLSTAANIFLGMVEAPLFIRPYLARLTRSELFVVMTGGMAGIAGTVLVLYATMLGPIIPDAAAHLVIASVLGAPAAILMSLIMVPETSEQHTEARSIDPKPDRHEHDGRDRQRHRRRARTSAQHLRDADRAGGARLSRQRHPRSPAGRGGAPISLQRVLGYAMAPVCWLMGIPWEQALTAGALMGIKTILNEFIAYVELSKLPADALDPRSRLIMLYAMCGFANFGSLGIMIGGLATMAPERRDDVVSLGLEIDRVGHAHDLPDRRDRRRADLARRRRRWRRIDHAIVIGHHIARIAVGRRPRTLRQHGRVPAAHSPLSRSNTSLCRSLSCARSRNSLPFPARTGGGSMHRGGGPSSSSLRDYYW